MGSHRDSNSDVPTEQSTSYFNASFFPESQYHNAFEELVDATFDANANPFDEGAISTFTIPQSYDNLRKATEAVKTTSATGQALILGSTNMNYQPYYPTNEEVPITAGLGTDLINWKLCRDSSSHTGTRSHTSDQRTSRSGNGQTPPTVCETATIVNGGRNEVELNDDIDLDEATRQDFTWLSRFKKQTSIIRNFDNVAQQSGAGDRNQFPSLASTATFFPDWEQQSYISPVAPGALNNMGMHFYEVDSTISRSQTQSSVFTGDNRRAAGTAPSVTSYTESSIADSAQSERYNARRSQVMPNYPLYLHEDDVATTYSGFSGHDSIPNAYYPTALPPDFQQFYNPSTTMAPPSAPITASYNTYKQPQPKRRPSLSPSPPAPKRRVKKEHICGTCNANFTEKTNLTRHIKSRKCTRTGAEMFFCPVSGCTRSYEGRSDNLKTHMRRVHRKEWQKLNNFQGDWKDKTSLTGWLYMSA